MGVHFEQCKEKPATAGPSGREHSISAMRHQRLSQGEVAELLGVTRGSVSMLERKAIAKFVAAWKRQDAILGPVRGIKL